MTNQEEADGPEVAATINSLTWMLKSFWQEERETTVSSLYYFTKHVSDLLQFARMAATTTKLQMIIETLQRAKGALEQKEEAEPLLRDAWQLMRKVLSREEVEKISASQIELRRSKMDPIIVSGADVWELVNHILRSWSTLENEDQRVEYIVSYRDGQKDGRWLKLPLFAMPYSGERRMIGPALDLGERITASLEKNVDLASEYQASFEVARLEVVTYLRSYAVGGSTCEEMVTTTILKIQDEQWSPNIAYRRWLHSEHNQREGSL